MDLKVHYKKNILIKKLLLILFSIGILTGCKNKNAEEWIRGIGAPLVLSQNESNVNIFTGFKVNQKNKNISKLELFEVWKIKNKEDADRTIILILLKNEEQEKFKVINNKLGIAWNYTRAIHIIGKSYLAGYYSREEALNKSLEVSKIIQQKFSSWEEYIECYLEDFQYITNNYEKTELLRARIIKLKNSLMSPYKVKWNMILEKNW